jgi:hypothetical protein
VLANLLFFKKKSENIKKEQEEKSRGLECVTDGGSLE